MEKYFSKYHLKFAGAFNNEPLIGPSIVWGVHSRVPGNAGGKAMSRGATHSKFRETTSDGLVPEDVMQYHTVVYEYVVVGSSSEEVDEIAWDLENFVRIAAGSVAETIVGFSMVFSEELSDRNMARNAQDDILRRTLRFIAQVPIHYDRYHTELRQIRHQYAMGRVQKQSGRLTRSSASTRYDIEVDDGQRVSTVLAIFKFNSNSTTTHLHENVDYRLYLDRDTQTLYIQWDDDYGAPPSVGQDFRVDYMLSFVRSFYQNE